jgi:hypothetical protein
MAEFEPFHFTGQFEHLNKQFGEIAEKSPSEGRQRVVIQVGASRDVAEGDRVVGRTFQLAA